MEKNGRKKNHLFGKLTKKEKLKNISVAEGQEYFDDEYFTNKEIREGLEWLS